MSYAGEPRAREPEVQLRPAERPALLPRVAPEPRIEAEPRVETAPRPGTYEASQRRELEAATARQSAEEPSRRAEQNNRAPIEPQWQDRTVQPERAKDPQQQQQASERRLTFTEARERMIRERHDAAWWDQRYQRVVRAGAGYYFFDTGWWYPAFGYDSTADVYPYEGPIYAFGEMTPDQEVAVVQQRLEADGYYSGSVTGVLDSTTQAAIAKFQAEDGLLPTGAIDQPTIEALGLV